MANLNIILRFETPEHMIIPTNGEPPFIRIETFGSDDWMEIRGEEIYNFYEAFGMAIQEIEKLAAKAEVTPDNPKS